MYPFYCTLYGPNGVMMRPKPDYRAEKDKKSHQMNGAKGRVMDQSGDWYLVLCKELPEGHREGWVKKIYIRQMYQSSQQQPHTTRQSPQQQPHTTRQSPQPQHHTTHQPCDHVGCNSYGGPIDSTAHSSDGSLHACATHMKKFTAFRGTFKNMKVHPMHRAIARIDFQALVSPRPNNQANGHIQFALKEYRIFTPNTTDSQFHAMCARRGFVFDLDQFNAYIARPR